MTRTTTRWAVLLFVGSSLLLLAAATSPASPKVHLAAQTQTTTTTTTTTQPSAVVMKLRRGVAWNTKKLWSIQTIVGVPHTPTSHAAWKTTSVPYLRWLKHRWYGRRMTARKMIAHGVKGYAHVLVLRVWHSEAQFADLNAIVMMESGWDPCATYPSRHDCSWNGPEACGVAQRYYCPAAFRGNLWATRWAQVRDLIAYVKGRYGSPAQAYYVRTTQHNY